MIAYLNYFRKEKSLGVPKYYSLCKKLKGESNYGKRIRPTANNFRPPQIMESQFPPFNPTSVATLVGIFVFCYYYLRRKWQERKQAPSPPGAWPIIGHLHLLHNAKLPHHTLGAMADKYGPIFRLQLGCRSALVVSNWEMAKESMCINDAAAVSRPGISGTKHFSYDYAAFGLAPYSPYWREMRKITHLELLSNSRVDQVKNLMFAQIDMSLAELHAGSAQIPVEMKRWFGDVIVNMLLKIIIGKRCVGPNAEGGEKGAKDLQMAIRDSFHLMGQGLLTDYIPLIGRLGFDGQVKVMESIAKRFDVIMSEWLEEHKRKRDYGLGQNQDGDFMDSLISLLDGKGIQGYYDADTIIKATTLNMIAGGTESTTVTLTWTMTLLLNNPHTLEMAQQELDAVVGRDRRVNESDISKLHYLQAVVKEAMRMYPAGPLLGPREFSSDCVVAGYFVPRGTQLIPNIWKIQTDPRVWPNPFEFKPERFLTTHKDVDAKGNHFELIPFGSGRRGCPGVAFGLQMVHFTLAGFLQSFDVKSSSADLIDMSENFGMANEKVVPLNVLVTSRLPSHLHGFN
ncbi:cytochrome P450 82A3-like [Momordica charantia]|uniref:Cytochrome P450 82A3-like n=1 Tax=Momordica charantia TaxID=3673 RepID=A0A6J1DJE5_MOMCH|nr:cytochrome P450 82A3-like [Momordica charantia]